MNTNSLQDSLLLTKLNRPRLSRDVVQRPRLLNQLQSPSSLVLVVAPAGYGKTTLVSSWLETFPMPSAWFALDESDNNIGIFLQYLSAAIQTRFPLIGGRTINLFRTAGSPSINSISHSLLNELSAIDQDFILVLDDYHLIHNSSIHKLLSELLHHPIPYLHLVLTARNDPPLPLPGLRAHGLVTELRGSDLGFTLDETTRFFREALHYEISDQDIATLENKVEGWPVILRLTAIYFKQYGSASLFKDTQYEGNRYLLDYLVSEVSAKLPADDRDFLIKTSFLDQLCGPLCDAVMGFSSDSGKSQKQLERLLNAELFTLAIENSTGWYRYHHLFRQHLLTEQKRLLSPDEIAALHLRASSWFESQGMLEKAITHAFNAGDTKTAVSIFIKNRRDITNKDDWLLLAQLVKMFPQSVIDSQPEMRLAEASVLSFQAQYSKETVILDEVESSLVKLRLTQPNRERLEGEIAARRSAITYFSGDSARCSVLAQSALEKLPPEWWQPRMQAKLFLSLCLQIQGDLNKALDVYKNSGEPDFGLAYRARQLTSSCFVHWLEADLTGIERAALYILEKWGEKDRPTEGVTWARYFLGVVHYHRNDLDKAEEYFSALVTNPHQLHTLCYVNSIVALALIYQLRGQVVKANGLSETLLLFSMDTDSANSKNSALALKAELAMRQGNLNEAIRWVENYRMPEKVWLPLFYASPITYVQALLAQNTAASRKTAARVLAKLKKSFTAEHQTLWLISVLSLRSLLFNADGEADKALEELRKAIRLAETGGFIRLFMDLGEPIIPILAKLKKQGESPSYLARILSAIEKQTPALDSGTAANAARQETLQASLGVTPREQEVLQLLDKRYTDKEIAETLVISRDTVHSHISHLSDKLGANGRRAIVQAARDIGLLD